MDSSQQQNTSSAKNDMFVNVTNYSRAKRLAQAMSPTARVRVQDDGGVVIYEDDGTKEVLGKGKTFQAAFEDATRGLTVQEIVELAGPVLSSIRYADAGITLSRSPNMDLAKHPRRSLMS